MTTKLRMKIALGENISTPAIVVKFARILVIAIKTVKVWNVIQPFTHIVFG